MSNIWVKEYLVEKLLSGLTATHIRDRCSTWTTKVGSGALMRFELFVDFGAI